MWLASMTAPWRSLKGRSLLEKHSEPRAFRLQYRQGQVLSRVSAMSLVFVSGRSAEMNMRGWVLNSGAQERRPLCTSPCSIPLPKESRQSMFSLSWQFVMLLTTLHAWSL